MLDQFVVLKFVGVLPECLGPLEAFVAGKESHVPEKLECKIISDGKSVEFYDDVRGTQCLRIIASERDQLQGTYTVKLILITAFCVDKYIDAEGVKQEAEEGHEYVIKPPLSIFSQLMSILQFAPSEESIELHKKY
jgi:hypothetical protein